MHISYSVQTAPGTSKPIRPGGLVNACLHGISVAEAEHALATVWQRIEEYGTEAPNLQFEFGRDGRIDIEFSFPNLTIAALILDGLTSSCSPPFQDGIARTDQRHNGYTGVGGLGARRFSPADWS